MELTTQVRIHRSVAASDVSALCSNHACSLAVVIWTYTFAVAISRLMPFSRSLVGCFSHIRIEHVYNRDRHVQVLPSAVLRFWFR